MTSLIASSPEKAYTLYSESTYRVALEVEALGEHELDGIHVERVVVHYQDVAAALRDSAFSNLYRFIPFES